MEYVDGLAGRGAAAGAGAAGAARLSSVLRVMGAVVARVLPLDDHGDDRAVCGPRDGAAAAAAAAAAAVSHGDGFVTRARASLDAFEAGLRALRQDAVAHADADADGENTTPAAPAAPAATDVGASGDDDDDDDEAAGASAPVRLVEDILRRCRYFLACPSPTLQVAYPQPPLPSPRLWVCPSQPFSLHLPAPVPGPCPWQARALGVAALCFARLARHRPRSFLPAIHQTWPALVGRLKEQAAALQVRRALLNSKI